MEGFYTIRFEFWNDSLVCSVETGWMGKDSRQRDPAGRL